jgi:hypothetical protein
MNPFGLSRIVWWFVGGPETVRRIKLRQNHRHITDYHPTMNKFLSSLLAAVVITSPVSVFAQDVPPVQATGGYSYLTRPNAVLVGVISDEPAGTSIDKGGSAPGSGWFAEIIGNITPYAAIVGQVSATYTTGTLNSRGWRGENTAYGFLGGGRASLRRRSIVPFGQVLVGWLRSGADVTEGTSGRVGKWSDSYWAVASGGGVDIPLGGLVGVHVATDLMWTSRDHQRVDYDRTWRLQAGVVIPVR